VRSNITVYGVLGFCFFVLAITYTTWNLISNGYVEWFGTTAFTFSTALMWWLTSYLWITLRKQGGELPEDTLTADMDTDTEIGHFYASSWWPIVLAFACSLVISQWASGSFCSRCPYSSTRSLAGCTKATAGSTPARLRLATRRAHGRLPRAHDW